jgi:hypothetical protein
MSDFML